jgi:serine/threonine protein kinase
MKSFSNMPTDNDHGELTESAPGSSDSAGTQLAQSSDPSAPTIASAADPSSEPTVPGQTQPLIGATLDGRYFIERSLGQGGMGQVYLAKDLQLHSRAVVVKLLLEETCQDEYILKKFRQEMEALSRIHHPGVIGIIDSGELADGKPFIVMEYVDGVNLRSVLKPEGMNLERAAGIIKQMGRALSAAHDKGIFHRDLKPENIMLQDLGHDEELVKIIDFGIAKIKQSVIAPSTATTATAGTIGYMAPEQLCAKPVAAAADVYSLGVIAYEMVAGRRPFNPETPFELLEMQRAGVRIKPVDLRPSLSLQAQQSILKALSFETKERYLTAREFGDELARALVNEEVTLGLHDRRSQELQQTIASSGPPTFPGSPTAPQEIIPVQAQPDWPATFEHSLGAPQPPPAGKPRLTFSLNTPWLKIAVGLFSFAIVALALYPVLYTNRSSKSVSTANTSNAPTASEPMPLAAAPGYPQQMLTYWLTVQKMRNGKPYEEPFESSGQEVFENGYGFRLNATAPQPGYLYVFNEGATASGDMSFTIIYPTPITNGGSAMVNGNQPIQTNWNRFGGQAGTEEFWMVWSTTPVAELEAARDAAFKNEKGKITDASLLKTVRQFLMKHSDPKPDVSKDRLKQQTMVRGGDPLVQLVELVHR